MSEVEAPVRPGDVLAGKYRVEEILGVGGMGVVVAATHVHLKDKVAIKFLLPHVTESPEHVARFLREAQAAVRIKSVHIARVTDVGVLDTGSPYMVMEHLTGKDLAAVLDERGRLSPKDAITYLLQACEALAEAHVAGIIHRDIKPSNLFLTYAADGSPCIKVLDFGISKSTEAGADRLTRTQAVIGSPLYMAPEQMRSARKVDPRADLWSLGVVLYELLVGEVPFVAESMPALVALVLESNPPKLREMLPSASPELEAIVTRCLESKVDARYPSIGPFATDLAAVLGTDEARIAAAKIVRVLGGGATQVEATGQQLALAKTAGVTTAGATTATVAAPRAGVQTAPGTSLGQTDVPIAEPAPKRRPVGLIVGGLTGGAALLAIAFTLGGRNAAQPEAAAVGSSSPQAPLPVVPSTSTTPSPGVIATPSTIAPAPSSVPSMEADAGGAIDAGAAVSPKPTSPRPAPPPTPAPTPKPSATPAPSSTPEGWDRKG